MATLSDSIPKFRYKPLDSPDTIRILLLHPAPASSASIQGDLIHSTISACENDLFEHYVALSYVWGSTDDLQSIFLEGHQFKITRNLSEALRNLREEKRAIKLWADAICINQQDDNERNQQVSLMGQIYSIARHTIIYLGDSTALIDAVLQHVVELGKEIYSSNDESHEALEELPSQIQLVARDLLDRAWFTRIWVFQELVLSRDPWVQCGKSRLKWAIFCDTLLHELVVGACDDSPTVCHSDFIIPEHHNIRFEMLRSLNDVRITYRIDKERQGVSELALVDLVTSRRGLGVTDPRDIIYGHMGLAGMPSEGVPFCSDSAKSLLRAPEYKKSVEDVFMDFAHDMIQWHGLSGILSYKEAICPSKRMPNLASWAPDWSIHPLKQPQMIEPGGEKWLSGAEATLQKRYSWIPYSRLLLALGETLKIVEVSRVIPWNPSDIIVLGDDDRFFARDFRWLLENHSIEDKLASSRAEWWDKLYWNICAHYSEAVGRQFLPKNHFPWALYPSILSKNPADVIQERSFHTWMLSDLVFAHTFQAKEVSILAGRRLAMLEGGQIALVPPMAQAGDVAYQLHTGLGKVWKSTFIFRPLDREAASNSLCRLSVSQQQALDNFRSYVRHSEGVKIVREEYEHGLLLGPARVFEKGGGLTINWRSGDTQLLVIH